MKSWIKELNNIIKLSLSLAKANFKIRNEGSYLGILWYLLSPLVLFTIILFVRGAAFSKIDIAFYPAYLLIGLIIYNLLNQVLSISINVISSNANFIKSMKISQESLVVSGVFQAVFSHFFEIFLLLVLMIYLQMSLIWIIFYPIILIVFIIFLLGTSLIFAIVGVYVNDLKNIWTIASSLFLFITPTFYVLQPGSAHYILNLFNPLFYFLTITRDIVIYHAFPETWMIITTILFSFVSLIIGQILFLKYKKRFAELI